MDPGDLNKIFRGFFGLNRPPIGGIQPPMVRDEDEEREHFRDEPGTWSNPPFSNFNVLTDPLEMHRFFEQQMEQMFQQFGGIHGQIQPRGFLDDGGGPEHGGGGGGGHQHFFEDDTTRKTDRDMMLKNDDDRHQRRQDSDVDDSKLSADELTDIFKKDSGGSSIERWNPRHRDMNPGFRLEEFAAPRSDFGSAPGAGSGFSTFSFSRSTRTVRRPDGSVETEERSRNPDGTETVRRWSTVGGEDPAGLRGHEDGPPSNQPNIGGFFFGRNRPEVEPPLLAPPPEDRQFTKIFSKFFGN